MIAACLLVLCSCAVKPNRWVTRDNFYYSEDLPKITIRIDNRFEYTGNNENIKEYRGESWVDWKTSDKIVIAVHSGYFNPEKLFANWDMISTSVRRTYGPPTYIGTDIYYDVQGAGEYYLRRLYVQIPNRSTAFALVCGRPLSQYGQHHNWSNLKNYTPEQNRIVSEFIKDMPTFFRVVRHGPGQLDEP